MQVAGVDGCDRGWLIVQAEQRMRLELADVNIQPAFAEVLRRTGNCDAVGIDIPIGLSDDGRRAPDIAARQVLRPLRHGSVFPAPIRPVLSATSYREACTISAAARPDGKMVSKQTYYLTRKIAEVDRIMSADLSQQERVVEVHPEVCFWKLNGEQPIAHPKKTVDGANERLRLLSDAFEDDLASVAVPRGAGREDLYDACAAAWTASRVAYGSAARLPADPPIDAFGLRMEIVY